jgi:hypothetical protein
MGKSRRSRSSVVKSITKTASKTLPVVNKSLKTVGSTAKNVASASIPVIEKGVSAVYGTMATGLDLGVKGAKSIAKGMSKGKHSKRRSIARTLSGGRRTRRRHRRH